MFKKKNAQGMSITVIIVAIIALIVLVAEIMIFSGKFDDFRSGIGKAVTCEDACKAIGYDFSAAISKRDCVREFSSGSLGEPIPGTYSDVSGSSSTGKIICCCMNKKSR